MRLEEAFSKIVNWLTPYFKDKKLIKTHKFTYELFHWANISGKLPERSCISCGKDTERYHKSLAKASNGVFRIVCSV